MGAGGWERGWRNWCVTKSHNLERRGREPSFQGLRHGITAIGGWDVRSQGSRGVAAWSSLLDSASPTPTVAGVGKHFSAKGRLDVYNITCPSAPGAWCRCSNGSPGQLPGLTPTSCRKHRRVLGQSRGWVGEGLTQLHLRFLPVFP